MGEREPGPGRQVDRFGRWLDEREHRFLSRTAPAGVAGFPLRAARVLLLAGRQYHRHDGGDRAAALAFTTLLALTPIALVLLRGLGPKLLRLASFWAILALSAVLAALSVWLPTLVRGEPVVEEVVSGGAGFATGWAAVFLLYLYLPARHTSKRAAAAGAVVAGA